MPTNAGSNSTENYSKSENQNKPSSATSNAPNSNGPHPHVTTTHHHYNDNNSTIPPRYTSHYQHHIPLPKYPISNNIWFGYTEGM
eukprot:5924875-Ditylum_brightwellii.AAC.1